MASREQILITKEHIVMHTNLILWFTHLVLKYTLVIKLLKVKVVLSQNSYCNTTSQSVFVSFANTHNTPTYKTEVLRLVSNVQLVKRWQIQHYLAFLRQ